MRDLRGEVRGGRGGCCRSASREGVLSWRLRGRVRDRRTWRHDRVTADGARDSCALPIGIVHYLLDTLPARSPAYTYTVAATYGDVCGFFNKLKMARKDWVLTLDFFLQDLALFCEILHFLRPCTFLQDFAFFLQDLAFFCKILHSLDFSRTFLTFYSRLSCAGAAGNPYRVAIRTWYVRCPFLIDNGQDIFCKESLGIGVSC